LPSGIEVDFIVNEMELAIEVKASAKVTVDHLRGLRELARDHRGIKQRLIVCLERTSRKTDDGIWILPATEFTKRLSSGDLF
jgi:predicted AAA+ superfamily ATPase